MTQTIGKSGVPDGGSASGALLSELRRAAVCCVATLGEGHIKSRMMHFAVSDDFRFYLTSMKDDPKTKQLSLCPEISLLVHAPSPEFAGEKEMEITGRGRIIDDKAGREKAIDLLMSRSPVVAQMAQYSKLDLLSFIEVAPRSIKFRRVADILRGVKPSVTDFGADTARNSMAEDFAVLGRKLSIWTTETRYPFVMAALLPALLGAAIARLRGGSFNPVHLALTLIGVALLHLGSNVVNDYFDHKSGADEANAKFIRPFSGGSRVIQSGLLSPSEVLAGALAFFAAGSAIGLYLAYKTGLPVLFLGLAGVLSGFFYAAPRGGWAKKGLGEIIVGGNFGVLVAMGSYYVQTRSFSAEVIAASLPLGILVAAILWINEIPDYESDKAVGKNTLVVRMGPARAAEAYAALVISGFAVLVAGVGLGYLPKSLLWAAPAALPFAVLSIRYALRHHENSFEMAPGNAMAVMTFNAAALTMILAYLRLAGFGLYVPAAAASCAAYMAYLFAAMRARLSAFEKIKALAAGNPA